ncbi:MAG TPA: alpha-2-macroglobulin family protein, partial [Chitinophagaceae bacterium]|nr:alpha-2-macroglobulin family protein [Chitinophagaceae bacterium]
NIGSSASDVFVIQEIKRETRSRKGVQVRSKYSYTSLNNEQKRLKFTGEADSYSIFHVFVKDNRYYTITNYLVANRADKDLQISYETYRDKTQPGSGETWKVKITGKGNDQAAAEMLTAMYDASLDQFKPHRWSKPQLWPGGYVYGDWNAASNFGWDVSIKNYQRERYWDHFERKYDKLLYGDVLAGYIRSSKYESGTDVTQMLAGKVPGVQVGGLEEVVVTGYGGQQKRELTAASSVVVRGASTTLPNNVLLVIDGVIYEGKMDDLNPADLESVIIMQQAEATALYGTRANNGVLLITTKTAAKKKPQEVQVRKNFNETAFFFPDLRTDEDGNIEFSFTMPEALTQWKWMIFSHTKDLSMGYSERTVVTQKELMVQPNIPRFVREGDRMDLSAKLVNMGTKELSGQIELQLFDVTNNQPVDGWFNNMFPNQYFTAEAGQSTVIKFTVQVPYQYNKPVGIRFIAKAGNMSDGEENTIPVLSNRLLVTETLPLNIRGTNSRNFTFDKLMKSDQSETLSHHRLTLEFTSNPAWYAVQALPYLMEYPYECSEQLWNRVYANALAAKIVGASPRIKQVFEKWKNLDTAALLSNLQKNEELKSLLLQETPWVMEASNESEQKKRIALLFDMVKLSNEMSANLEKLSQLQLPNGAFAWFKGGREDRHITQYIVAGIGHLRKLNAIPAQHKNSINALAENAIRYLDTQIKADYDRLVKDKRGLTKQHIGYTQINYLYMRSFFNDIFASGSIMQASSFYRKQSQQFWLKQSRYMQGMIALSLFRTGDSQTALSILRSLKENAITHDELGMYWKDNTGGYYWYQAPIETQALLIEAFTEISKDTRSADAMKTWLLKHKQTNNWNTTKSTAEACYALLLQGTDWLTSDPVVQIKLGDKTISSLDQKQEAGTGYFKKTFDAPFINNSMGNISVNITRANGTQSQTAWGAVYWQYFENLENITAAATPLKISKKLFVERNTDRGPVLEPVEQNASLKTGDKIKVRIELRVDRDMEYVHMKDMRASSLEPVNVISSYKWQDGLGYYESTKDASTNFFFNYLPKGTYVFEYPLFVTHTGTFSNGITTIQCMYAPEFSSHTEGVKINVE